MPGSIVRVDSDPYEFKIPDTQEVVILAHRWSYQPAGVSYAQAVPTL